MADDVIIANDTALAGMLMNPRVRSEFPGIAEIASMAKTKRSDCTKCNKEASIDYGALGKLKDFLFSLPTPMREKLKVALGHSPTAKLRFFRKDMSNRISRIDL